MEWEERELDPDNSNIVEVAQEAETTAENNESDEEQQKIITKKN